MYDYDDVDALLLNRPLSTTSDADPDDVLSAKSTFNRLGYYEVPSYGLTPHPDQPLFDGIRDYQKDNALTVDGYMLPGGETEQSVNFSLATSGRNAKNDREDDACAEPAIQPWQLPPWGMPGRRNYCPLPREQESEEERERRCNDQWERDNDRCRGLGRLPHISGEARRARCWSSAMERLAACLRGRKYLPELDTGEW